MRHLISAAIILGCSLLVSASALSQSIRVPGFQPGDGERHHYIIMRFRERAHTSLVCAVDQDGMLFYNVGVNWEHIYIYSQDHITGENLYNFDLNDFPLLGFVHSLAASQRRLPPPGTILRDPSTEGMLGVEVAESVDADKLVPNLYGENLTFDETLEMLRIASDCDIFHEGDKLIIDWCG